MSAATQIYYASFDDVFLKLPAVVRARVESEIDDLGSRLGSYAHHRLGGSNRFRARVGDYRVIYAFDFEAEHHSSTGDRTSAGNLEPRQLGKWQAAGMHMHAAQLGAAMQRRKHLPRIEQALVIEGAFQPLFGTHDDA